MEFDTIEVAELDNAMDGTFGTTLGEVVPLSYSHGKTLFADRG